MDALSAYTVIARRWEHGWELEIHDDETEVGVTQSRTLAGAERMVRDYLAVDLGADPASFEIEIQPELTGELAEEVRAAREGVRVLERTQREVAARSRTAARHLKEAGLSGSEIAAVLGVSTQRVSQLVNS
jgi:DNA-directed RNA polymerase specialized sigma subunit